MPSCPHLISYLFSVPGGGVQVRCKECDRFLEWQELPKSIKKKGEK